MTQCEVITERLTEPRPWTPADIPGLASWLSIENNFGGDVVIEETPP